MVYIIKEESNNGVAFLPSENNHVAVCIGFWDIGQRRTDFNGKVKIKNQILFRWELDEEIEDGEYKGKKRCLNNVYTASFHEKSSLRRDLESWRGKLSEQERVLGFDLEKMVGESCMINIVHNESGGKMYANIGAISKVPKGLEVFTPDNIYRDEIPSFVEGYRARNLETLNVIDSPEPTVATSSASIEAPMYEQ